MKLIEYKSDFYQLSGKASDINRQIAFAGIAIIWIFRITKNDTISMPTGLLLPVKLFVFGLALDLIHYVWSSSTWGIFHMIKEWQFKNENKEVSHSRLLVVPIWILFYLKIFSVLLAYYFLFRFVGSSCFK
ncbi:MAG: hypothetical protein GXY77_05610 [Fibrobacter sp.]|nr:hypothetical protein [Fibrobacter sp.]